MIYVLIINAGRHTMTVKYTTTTKSGLTKTRTSKAHKEPIYTHALWVKGKPDERIQRY